MRNFSFKMAKLLSFSFASSLLLSLSPSQPASQDVPLLKRIRDYWKEGDFSLAKKQIHLYLEKNPQGELNEELHLLLGDLYLQEGNFATALEEYAYLAQEDLKAKSFYNKALCLYETKQYKDLLSLTEMISSQNALTSNQIRSIRYLCAVSLQESGDPSVYHEAVSLFEASRNSEFAPQSLSSLASLYLLHDEKEKAAECYLALAEMNASDAPNLRFQAATLLSEKAPQKAIDLFQKILFSSSLHKTEAAYNTIVLLYQTGQFQALCRLYEDVSPLFSNFSQTEVNYLVGKSLYRLQEYEKALPYLKISIEDLTFSENARIESGLIALSCASGTENCNVYKEILEIVQTFPLEKEKQKQVELGYLSLIKKQERPEDLAIQAENFLQKFPESPESKDVLLDLVYGFYQSKQWSLAKTALENFWSKYPLNAPTDLLRLKLDCCSMLLQESSQEDLSNRLKEWITVVQHALEVEGLFSPQEKEICLLELSKNLFLEESFAEALDTVQNFLTDFPNSSFKEDVHLIQVLCYLKDSDSSLLFALHAEKFLEEYPNNNQSPVLRIQLFNTYLSQAEASLASLQQELLDKAANHLYSVFEQKHHTIEKQNLQWLADYHYKLSRSAPSSIQKGIALFEQILADSLEKPVGEENIYKLSNLLSLNGNIEKKVSLLEKSIHLENTTPSSLQKHFLFDLAKSYKMLGNSQKALQFYDLLILSSNHSQLGREASLERAKILFSTLREEDKTETNPICQEILDNLKDLENQRALHLEPLHIEAGLEYVECKSSLIKDPILRSKKKQDLLKISLENLASSYEGKDLSEKQEILAAYEKFMNAEILFLQGNQEEGTLLLQELEKIPSIPSALQDRIKTSLELKVSL